MSKVERKQRFALIAFFSTVVFFTLVFTLISTGLLVYLFNRWGFFIPDGEAELSLMRSTLLMMILSLVIGTAITIVVIRIPLNPINSVLSGMRSLATGDYKARIDMGGIFGKNPVGYELVESFNLLASELESTEMLRSDFINNFSHEFKTPIVSISGFAKLLKRGNLTEAEKLAYLDIIEEESLRLAYMATNVLDLTKVENQTILTDLTEYNLSEQLRDCILMLENKWAKKNMELNLEFDEHKIYANEELMKQVWINLIDNAVKFSPSYGFIGIKVNDREGAIEVSISNSGDPIAPESAEKLFNKFYQADESHASEGNGIGLAIVKRITELHKGSVTVRSENGVNSFTVSIPQSGVENIQK